MVLLPFYILAALSSAAISLDSGAEGWGLLAMLIGLFIGGFFAWLIIYVLVAAVIGLFMGTAETPEKPNAFARAVVIYSIGIINAIFGVKIQCRGFEKLPAEGRWLFVCNHRSGFDALANAWALRKHDVAFIMKPAIMKIPIAKPFLHHACFMAIDRESDREALKTIIRATRLIKAEECSIAVYPEGTRNKGDGLLPFRNGAFKIAQRGNVPVVVAVCRGADKVLRRFPFHHSTVEIEICSVLSAEEISGLSTTETGDRVREIMLEKL